MSCNNSTRPSERTQIFSYFLYRAGALHWDDLRRMMMFSGSQISRFCTGYVWKMRCESLRHLQRMQQSGSKIVSGKLCDVWGSINSIKAQQDTDFGINTERLYVRRRQGATEPSREFSALWLKLANLEGKTGDFFHTQMDSPIFWSKSSMNESVIIEHLNLRLYCGTLIELDHV